MKIRCVIGRLQGRTLGMTEFATERRVDLVMTDQAIGHLRQSGLRQRRGLLHTAMAGRAGVRAVEIPADIVRRREIGFRIDGRANHRRDISQREVLLVIETQKQSRPRLPHARLLMTPQADIRRREVVVFEPGRGLNGRMAGEAG